MLFKVVSGLALTTSAVSAAKVDATPLSKIVGLLKSMKTQIEKEISQDQEVFDKLACWCHTNREEKTQAVADNQQMIEQLESQHKELVGREAQLSAELKELNKEIAEEEAALKQGQALHDKESAEAYKYQKDTTQALGQLKGALTVLKKHQGAALTQETIEHLSEIVKHASYRFPNVISTDDARSATSLLQARPYANQSNEIFGILQAMSEQMTSDLADSQSASQKATDDFQKMREAKESELAAARELKGNKEDSLATTTQDKVNTKGDLTDEKADLENNTAFLADLEKKCAANEEEFAARQKSRHQEVTAINETVDILTADEARDVAGDALGRTAGTAFLQMKVKTTRMNVRLQASTMLRKVAMKHGNPELSMLASSVQLNAFTKVKKAIDDMVSQLKAQKQDEVKHRDYCIKSIQENEDHQSTNTRKLSQAKDLETATENQIKEFTEKLKQLNEEIAANRVELQAATNLRKSQNAEWRQTVADQTATRAVIDKAMERMRAFYGGAPGFLQQPAGLNKDGFKQNNGSHSVLAMLEEIKGDSQEAENEATKSEQDAQTAYEAFVGDTNKTVDDAQKAVVNNTAKKADADEALVQVGETIASLIKKGETLAATNGALHTECDFYTKNFDKRQSALADEIEALRQAKQILSGAQ